MEFDAEGRLFFTERNGSLKVAHDNKISTLIELKVESRPNDEGGMLGLALSPNFTKDHHVYLYYTYKLGGGVWNRVCRYTESRGKLTNMRVIIDNIPGGRVHNGGRIKFGPDGKLYITTGETWKRHLAQDRRSLAGKILRINPDGSTPDDNPWGSPVYTMGNRNPQGLAWHPVTDRLYSSEHGPSGENGWRAHDEINLITPGANYGWPNVIGAPRAPGFTDPIVNTGDDTWAPSGICFYTGNRFPSIKNHLLVATLRGRHLRVIDFEEPEYETVASSRVFYQNEIGRIRDVVAGPDGYIYVCTSNRDGRGDPVQGDDFILRVTSLPEG